MHKVAYTRDVPKNRKQSEHIEEALNICYKSKSNERAYWAMHSNVGHLGPTRDHAYLCGSGMLLTDCSRTGIEGEFLVAVTMARIRRACALSL